MTKTYIDKLAFIEVREDKVLMVRSRGKNIWYTVGGKREEGETDQSALIREVREELNVNLNPDTLQYYGTFEAQAHGKPPGTLVRLTCYTGACRGSPRPSAEVEKIGWLSYNQKDQTSAAGKLIFDGLKQKGLIR
jgi:8-oxo-dGTP diphosphatase